MQDTLLREHENLYTLRNVIDIDHEFLVDLHNDPEVLKNITNPNPITLESHLLWWENLNKEKEHRLIFTVNGEKAGFTKFYSIDNVNNNCVLGADIHMNFRGQGHAKHMWALMLQYAFQKLKLFRVSLTTAEFNDKAIHIYKNLGFIEEGRFNKSLCRGDIYYDQILMYMISFNYA